jgi:hypothetical protein
MMEEPKKELLDLDIAARTAMLFGLEMSREDAYNALGVPLSQSDEWDDLWDALEAEAKRKARKG